MHRTLQMLSYAMALMRSDTRMTNPKLDPRDPVKVAVWVRKPGPMADVAIRKAAPIMAPLAVFFLSIYNASVWGRSPNYTEIIQIK